MRPGGLWGSVLSDAIIALDLDVRTQGGQVVLQVSTWAALARMAYAARDERACVAGVAGSVAGSLDQVVEACRADLEKFEAVPPPKEKKKRKTRKPKQATIDEAISAGLSAVLPVVANALDAPAGKVQGGES